MIRDHVERRETGFYITGSRVPIDRLIWEYRNGEDPETIRSHYPTLTLEQVNGAIAFYESHKEEVEQRWQRAGARRMAMQRPIPTLLISSKSLSACGDRSRRDEPNG
jgi:uncharacterized protein (DUF433 family)